MAEEKTFFTWWKAVCKEGERILVIRAETREKAVERVKARHPDSLFFLVPLPDDEIEVLD